MRRATAKGGFTRALNIEFQSTLSMRRATSNTSDISDLKA